MAESLREQLAALEHERWGRWMKHMFGVGKYMPEDGTWVMPAKFEKRWLRQMYTAYQDLSETEKDSDRAEADRTIAVIQATVEG